MLVSVPHASNERPLRRAIRYIHGFGLESGKRNPNFISLARVGELGIARIESANRSAPHRRASTLGSILAMSSAAAA